MGKRKINTRLISYIFGKITSKFGAPIFRFESSIGLYFVGNVELIMGKRKINTRLIFYIFVATIK